MKKTVIFVVLSLMCAYAAAQELPSYDWANFGRYAAANEALAGKQPLAVIMGDSITDGWFSADSAFFQNNNIAGRGISGQVTNQMLVRFRRDVIDLHPEYVIIIAGINDIARNQGYISQENIMGNFQSMCQLASANGIIPILATLIPADKVVWRPAITDTHEQVAALNEKIRAYASANGYKIIDLEVLLADENGAPRSDLSKDSIHPNLAGYKVMEEAVLAVLQSGR